MSLKDELMAIVQAQQQSAAQLVRDFQALAQEAQTTLNYYFLPQYAPIVEGVNENPYQPVEDLRLPNLNDLLKEPLPERPKFLEPEAITQNPLQLLTQFPEVDLTDLFDFTAPAAFSVEPPKPPTVKTNFLFPAPPTLQDITIPPLIDVNIPGYPNIPELPEFVATRPTLTYNVEDLSEVFQEGLDQGLQLINSLMAERTSAVIDKYYPKVTEQASLLDQYLCDYVEGKIRAIPATVWDQIYARFQARNDAQATRAANLVTRESQRVGLPFMSDDVRAGYFKAQADSISANYDANIAVIEQEANREFQQMQFTLNLLQDTRKSCSALWVSLFESTVIPQVRTAIELANSLVASHAEFYNQLVRKFEAEVRLYLADAQVWEIRAKYVFLELELYKQQLEAAKLESEVNTQLLQQTEQRIALDERFLRLYGLEIENIRAQIEAEELKIRAYEAQIRAFQLLVAAKDSEINLYRARIEGDEAKIAAELAKVRAYEAQLATIREYINAEVALNTNKQQYNAILAGTRDSDIRATLANFEQERATEQNKIEVFRSQIQQLSVLVQQSLDAFRTENATQSLNANIALDQSRLVTEQQRINMSVINEQRQALGQVQLGASKVTGDVAGAVNAGINQFINVGSQEIANV